LLRSFQEIQPDFVEEAKAYAELWSQGKKKKKVFQYGDKCMGQRKMWEWVESFKGERTCVNGARSSITSNTLMDQHFRDNQRIGNDELASEVVCHGRDHCKNGLRFSR
jgi:hypothetical protein